MTDYHINVFYSEEDGGYIADIPDLEFCSAFGATVRHLGVPAEFGQSGWPGMIIALMKPMKRVNPPVGTHTDAVRGIVR